MKNEKGNTCKIPRAEAVKICVKGTVQGVGFRPFVYRLAKSMGFTGFVKNTPRGVEIHLEGDSSVDEFIARLREEAPPNARIDTLELASSQSEGFTDFQINITAEGQALVFAPPDLSTCSECLEELFNPSDRRFRYPFINCTACGPRYTIIRALPYDREKTSMASFQMCPSCNDEYNNPVSRRFHAEPNACPVCGPETFFVEGETLKKGGIDIAAERIRHGKIVAVKGLGGFHLMCDPFNPEAVKKLRLIKQRSRKPFALMARDVNSAKSIAVISPEEEEILTSPSRPIVLLRKKMEIEGVSSGLSTYGIMLPYTPLHALLLENIPVVIATSANPRESPILKDESEIPPGTCDCMLTHNREIVMRCDDSLVKVVDGCLVFLRRGRGYVPEPLELRFSPGKRVLALGGELKNTVSIVKEEYLVTSQYLGDMKDLRNQEYLDEVISHFKTLYSFEPDILVCDLHPAFTTTKKAENWGRPLIRVQHHVAHVFAVFAEHSIIPDAPVLGIAFDGMGYGEDGNVWGGEFFVIRGTGYERIFHFRYVRQQGGDLAVKEPWRMVLAYTLDADINVNAVDALVEVDARIVKNAENAIKKGINAPYTSSVGRLFDTVAVMTGVAPEKIDFEAEAAMRLEGVALADVEDYYPFRLEKHEIDMREMMKTLLKEKAPPQVKAGKFHNTIVQIIKSIADICRSRWGINKVVLSGGVFLNALLMSKTCHALQEAGFEVLKPEKFSPGDESISLGQAYYTALKLKEQE